MIKVSGICSFQFRRFSNNKYSLYLPFCKYSKINTKDNIPEIPLTDLLEVFSLVTAGLSS